MTVIVGTYGDPKWADLAQERAIPSALGQAELIHVHAKSLAEARNAAAKVAMESREWLIFLDADDELAPGYVDAMMAGSADLRGPAIQYIYPNRIEPPKLLAPKNLRRGNYLPIGTAIRAEMFEAVGGFRAYPAWEDWDLWVRCLLRGATIEQVPRAVYRAYVQPKGRNDLSPKEAAELMRRMRKDHVLEELRLRR